MAFLGKLDTGATLLKNTPTRGDGGAVVDTFSVLIPKLWLGKPKEETKNRLASALEIKESDAVFVSRFSPLIEEGRYLDVEGKRYRIERVVEIGRREGWTIYGKAVA